MKKAIVIVVSMLGMVLYTSCEPTNLADDEIEYQATDKKDSVNSNGGPNPTVDPDEE
jgi:hypothetical protein